MGRRREVDAPLGASVLDVARAMTSTSKAPAKARSPARPATSSSIREWYELLKEASEDEEDMLDLAFNLTATSRLGCQIVITEELDGLTVRLPAATRNLLLG